MRRLKTLALIPLAIATLTAACSTGNNSLVVYSGRNRELVAPLLDRFTKETGVPIEVRYAETPVLTSALIEEGASTPANVFLAQDAGSLGVLAERGMLAELHSEILDKVPPEFRGDKSTWVGVSGRARVTAYNTSKLQPKDVPNSVFDLTNARWKGKVAIAPRNASFQSFISAMILQEGEERTQRWLADMKANDVVTYPNNLTIVEAIGRGEVELGLVNHYYLHTVRREQGDVPVANHFLTKGDPGALVNAAGVAILKGSEDQPEASRFVKFLLGSSAQQYFTKETGEYSLVNGASPPPDTPPLAEVTGTQVNLSQLGAKEAAAVAVLKKVGLL